MRWIEPAASGFIRFRRIYLVTSLQVINCNSRISFRKINWMSNMPARYAVHENKQRTFDEKCGISMTKFFEKPFHIWIHVLVASSTESKCSDSIFKWFGLVFIGAGHLICPEMLYAYVKVKNSRQKLLVRLSQVGLLIQISQFRPILRQNLRASLSSAWLRKSYIIQTHDMCSDNIYRHI